MPVAVAGMLCSAERIRAVAEAAPWKLCGNERVMRLTRETAAQLPWGLLAAGSWYSRRPTRWLKVGLPALRTHASPSRHNACCAAVRSSHLPAAATSNASHAPAAAATTAAAARPRAPHNTRSLPTQGLDGAKDFDYGLYVHEAAAQELLGPSWGGRAAPAVLSDRGFYRDALGLAPRLGMSLLAVASRPLPLQEVTA